jgi:hypothetical protein
MIDLGNDWPKQYQGRTLSDMEREDKQGNLKFDGIDVSSLSKKIFICLLILSVQRNMLASYHEMTQRLCSVLQPSCAGPEIRHDWSKTERNPRVLRYDVEGSEEREEREERRGVTHIVQGWIQQGQIEKVCLKKHKLSTLHL